MDTYHKIPNIFNRDHETNQVRRWDWADPVVAGLFDHRWVFTEKLDGMNIRVMYTPGEGVRIAGKTDRAQIKQNFRDKLERDFPIEVFAEKFPEGVCLYGEGVGPGIQAGGGRYSDSPHFVLFDVKIGKWWLQRGDVVGIAGMLRVPVVPKYTFTSLYTAINAVTDGLGSLYRPEQIPLVEGVVGTPVDGLLRRDGSRIIVKLKTRDLYPRPVGLEPKD